MADHSEKILKALLWWLVVFHGGLGLLGLFAKGSAEVLAEWFFNFQLDLSPQMYWVLNPFAAYLLAFAAVMAIAAWDPRRYVALIYVAASLLGLRVLQLVYFLLTAEDDLIAGDLSRLEHHFSECHVHPADSLGHNQRYELPCLDNLRAPMCSPTPA